NATKTSLRAMIDYCAVSGVGGEYWNYGPYNGVIVRYPGSVRLKNITDGTSRSLMFSEKRMEPSGYGGGPWYDDQGYVEGWDVDTVRLTCAPYTLAMDAPVPEDTILGTSLGSAHPTGVNGVFADGSTRFIAYDISQAVLDALGDRRDGLATDLTSAY